MTMRFEKGKNTVSSFNDNMNAEAIVNEVTGESASYGYEVLEIKVDTNGRATIHYRKLEQEEQTTPKGPFATREMRWYNHFKNNEGKLTTQYSYCGDINYCNEDEKYDECFRGNTPEDILYRTLAKNGVHITSLLVNIEYEYDPGYEKMSLDQLLDLAETMCEENPITDWRYKCWEEKYQKAEPKGSTDIPGEMRKAYNELPRKSYFMDPEDSFGLFCWTRGAKPQDAKDWFATLNQQER